ncbi:hypothetical protein Tco_1067250, partial [Tanacetum coccineum]
MAAKRLAKPSSIHHAYRRASILCAAVEVAEASDSRSLPSFQYPQNRLQYFDPQTTNLPLTVLNPEGSTRHGSRQSKENSKAVEVVEANDSRSLPSFQYPQNRLQDFDPLTTNFPLTVLNPEGSTRHGPRQSKEKGQSAMAANPIICPTKMRLTSPLHGFSNIYQNQNNNMLNMKSISPGEKRLVEKGRTHDRLLLEG